MIMGAWTPNVAALIIGLFWIAFHLPLWIRPEFGYAGIPFGAFALSTMALSVTYNHVVNKSRASLFTVTLTHFLQSFGPAFAPALGKATGLSCGLIHSVLEG